MQQASRGLILYVEDERDVREFVSEILASEGFRTVAAAHGQEALDYLQSGAELPRVILLDLQMPVMDGWTLAAHLKANPAWSPIPLVVQTALPIGAPEAMTVLTKPIRVEQLLAVIAQAVTA